MNNLIVLVGDAGCGKTYTVSGKRVRGGKLGATHAGHDCLMSRVPWVEGPKLEEIEGLKTGGTRVVELGRRPVAYPWSFDRGAWSEEGRVAAIEVLFSRYSAILTDAQILARSQSGLRILDHFIDANTNVAGVYFLPDGALADQVAGRSGGEQAGRDWFSRVLKSSGMTPIQRTVQHLAERGYPVTPIARPYVDGLIGVLKELP